MVDIVVRPLPDSLFAYGYRYKSEDNESSILEEFMEHQQTSSLDDKENQNDVEIEGRLVVRVDEDGTEEVSLCRGGSFLRLILDDLVDFSYFSGMKVTLRCLPTCPGSYNAKVVGVVPPSILPLAQIQGEHDFLRVVFAFGPMVQDDNFDHLSLLMDKSGPFYNDELKAVEQTRRALQLIETKLADSRTRVLILPNAQHDILSPNFFPTPALTNVPGLDPRFQLVSDPAIVTLNGVTFVITNSRSIQHLSGAERYAGTNSNRERMSRLCLHLLEQRSTCPVLFGPTTAAMNNINNEHITERPHFFIVPSNLAPIKKVAQNVVFVNPGRFLQGNKLRYTKVDVNIKRARFNNGNELGLDQFSSVDHKTEVLPEKTS